MKAGLKSLRIQHNFVINKHVAKLIINFKSEVELNAGYLINMYEALSLIPGRTKLLLINKWCEIQ